MTYVISRHFTGEDSNTEAEVEQLNQIAVLGMTV